MRRDQGRVQHAEEQQHSPTVTQQRPQQASKQQRSDQVVGGLLRSACGGLEKSSIGGLHDCLRSGPRPPAESWARARALLLYFSQARMQHRIARFTPGIYF